MYLAPPFIRPAPVILSSGTVASLGASQPFTQNFTPHADSDCVVWRVGYARNQDRTFGTATFATFNMVEGIASEDNGGVDRAGFAIFYITKASYISQGGSAANWATSQQLSVSCPEGNPDSWHGFPVSLRGVRTALVPGSSQSSGVASKSVSVDTRVLGKRALILGGRCIGRTNTITYTADSGATEEQDNGANSTSFWCGRNAVADGIPPSNFSFGCTASSTAFDGDAMAAIAFVG